MNEPSGVGKASSGPEGASHVGDEGPSKADISGLLHAKVATLGELKAVLIAHLGEKDGTKFYNQFMTSFAMIMLQQIQDSAQHAKDASQNMRNTQ